MYLQSPSPSRYPHVTPPFSFAIHRDSQISADGDGDDHDDGESSINSSVTGFPARGTVGFAVS